MQYAMTPLDVFISARIPDLPEAPMLRRMVDPAGRDTGTLGCSRKSKQVLGVAEGGDIRLRIPWIFGGVVLVGMCGLVLGSGIPTCQCCLAGGGVSLCKCRCPGQFSHITCPCCVFPSDHGQRTTLPDHSATAMMLLMLSS